jgi:hypothetical protein
VCYFPYLIVLYMTSLGRLGDWAARLQYPERTLKLYLILHMYNRLGSILLVHKLNKLHNAHEEKKTCQICRYYGSLHS